MKTNLSELDIARTYFDEKSGEQLPARDPITSGVHVQAPPLAVLVNSSA